jgi:hypothetical protein
VSSAIRAALIVLSGMAGFLNLFLTVRRRQSPTEFRGCLIAAAAFLLFAAALWAQAARHNVVALSAAGLAAACALLWLYHIYLQSLHNTTM